MKTPWIEGPADLNIPIKEEYDKHRPIILKMHNEEGSITKTFNYPVNHFNNLQDQIASFIKNIYKIALETYGEVFKINFALGLMLVNVVTGEYRYFKPYPGAGMNE